MTQTYFTLVTHAGLRRLADAAATGTKLGIEQMAVGDGNGSVPVPDPAQTQLVNEWYRAPINSISLDPKAPNRIIVEMVLPAQVGGSSVRELGLINDDGELVAVANTPPSYKPTMAEGSGRTQLLRLVIIASDASLVEMAIDPSVVMASQEFVLKLINEVSAKQAFKQVRVATNKVTDVGGLQVVDGIQLREGDRVLLKDHTYPNFNGIYIASRGSWKRSPDADDSGKIMPNMLVAVAEGHENADTLWQLVSDAPIRLSTTALQFRPIYNAQQVDQLLAPKAPLNSPQFTGTPEVPSPPDTDNSFKACSTEWVNDRCGDLTGSIQFFARNTPPRGFLKANGAAVSRSAYARLFARIGTTFGAGDGASTFNIPDVRGVFLRAWDDGRGIDVGRVFASQQSSSLESHGHAATCADSGAHTHSGTALDSGHHAHGASALPAGTHSHTAWTNAQGEHAHSVKEGHAGPGAGQAELLTSGDDYTYAIAGYSTTTPAGNHGHNVGIGAGGDHAHGVAVDPGGIHGHNLNVTAAPPHSHVISIASSGGAETRPTNLALLACIKH